MMAYDELDFKIRHTRNMTDDEWLECYEEYEKLGDKEKQHFKRTVPGHALGNMVTMIWLKRFFNKALEQQKKYGRITEKCPFCGNEVSYIQVGNSCKIRCATTNCITREVKEI